VIFETYNKYGDEIHSVQMTVVPFFVTRTHSHTLKHALLTPARSLGTPHIQITHTKHHSLSSQTIRHKQVQSVSNV